MLSNDLHAISLSSCELCKNRLIKFKAVFAIIPCPNVCPVAAYVFFFFFLIFPCPNVYQVAAYLFFLVFIFPLSLIQCVTSVRPIFQANTSFPQRSTCCYIFHFPEKSLVQKVKEWLLTSSSSSSHSFSFFL